MTTVDILIIRMNIKIKVGVASRGGNGSRMREKVVRKIRTRKQEQDRFTRQQVPRVHPWRPKVCPQSLAYPKSIMSSCHGVAA